MKLCLDVHLLFGWQSGVEAIGVDVQGGEERSDLLGPPSRRAVHDRTACCLRRQMPGQELVDVVELLGASGLGHDELQIRAPAAAVEHCHVDVEVLPEVVDDLLDHVRLSRGGQTQHRRHT